MLVRFLSFAASMIGTRRYRPILISLVAVVLSVASIVAVASVLEGDPHGAASTSGQKSPQTERSPTPSLDGLDKQATREEPQEPSTGANEAPAVGSDSTKPAAGQGGSQSTLPMPDVTLSTSALTLSATTPTLAVSATVSDKSTVTWSVAPDSSDTDVIATIEPASGGQSGMSVRFRLGQNARPGTYQFTITAKDGSRALDISKKITVTVNS